MRSAVRTCLVITVALSCLAVALGQGLAEAGINPGSGSTSDPGSSSLCGITFSVYDGDTSNLGDLTQEQMSQVAGLVDLGTQYTSKGIKMSITKLQGIKGAGGQGGRGVAIDLCLSCTPSNPSSDCLAGLRGHLTALSNGKGLKNGLLCHGDLINLSAVTIPGIIVSPRCNLQAQL